MIGASGQSSLPAAITVLPGPTNARLSTLALQQYSIAAGSNVTGVLIPLDPFGNRRRQQGTANDANAVVITTECIEAGLSLQLPARYQSQTSDYAFSQELIAAGDCQLAVRAFNCSLHNEDRSTQLTHWSQREICG